MVSQIFIRVGPGERRLSLLENGKLVRAVVDRETTHNVINGIYLGRVCKVNKMLDAAFVDIGNGIQGFLSATQAQIFDPTKDKPKPKAGNLVEKDADTRALEADLSVGLGMKVLVSHVDGTETGTISITYSDLDQLDDLCRILSATQQVESK